MKILTIIGARPQFIKAAALSREIAKHEGIQEIIIHTGQHFDVNMSEIFFQQMHIPQPDYYLGINSLRHGAMTGKMLEKIERIIQEEHPDWVLVYGDTNSTIAGALAAKKLHVKVAHVEAGLRSFNMEMPEEVNRILTDRISDILFCPTDTAIENLKREGYDYLDIAMIKSGDVMQDAAMFYSQYAKAPKLVKLEDDFVLCTIHRAENTDNIVRLKDIISALNVITINKRVILPIHPRTRKIIEENNIRVNFTMIEPVGYLEMIYLLERCKFVMTDSGGLQKEAFFFKKPCITIRDETEWVELVDHGVNDLAGADTEKIIQLAIQVEKKTTDFTVDLYGGGKASERIVKTLSEYNEKTNRFSGG